MQVRCQEAAPAAQDVERLDMPGLPNLAHVEGGVFRGGRPRLDQGGMESLQKLGIKTVINLQGGDLNAPSKSHIPEWSKIVGKLEPGEKPDVIDQEIGVGADAGIEVVNIPLDSLDPITDAEAQSLESILKILSKATPRSPVYVHCEHGKDRTGLVIALYRIRYDRWDQGQAYQEMKEMGHTGWLDEHFTGNMDPGRVLDLYPGLALAGGSAP